MYIISVMRRVYHMMRPSFPSPGKDHPHAPAGPSFSFSHRTGKPAAPIAAAAVEPHSPLAPSAAAAAAAAAATAEGGLRAVTLEFGESIELEAKPAGGGGTAAGGGVADGETGAGLRFGDLSKGAVVGA
jgi:hypothetical protein